ncbi:hypothetical protein GCM10010994_49080 [Chelatococcus reniformis]|jgi:hypothetical protein|uniref:Sulfur globule protein n=1 Tax=Chelatococcus reniformis TaxID=1494448 RepID=A0A916XND4_9HYPH|nr:hypothetical protein GCM10010994_49080 [Chelatococcus reniformis]
MLRFCSAFALALTLGVSVAPDEAWAGRRTGTWKYAPAPYYAPRPHYAPRPGYGYGYGHRPRPPGYGYGRAYGRPHGGRGPHPRWGY